MHGSSPADFGTFARLWASSPRMVGAVAPSGKALASLMTREIDETTGQVLELSPGTGVFTRALIDRGVREADLTLVESGPDFAALLRSRFPRACILETDAGRMGNIESLRPNTYGAVVSGLPLLNFPLRKNIAILESAFELLRPGGAYFQFTYGLHCPVPRRVLDRLGLRAQKIGSALLNLPPASVYRIKSRSPLRRGFRQRMP